MEMHLTFNNVIWFKDKLGKYYWMKTHVKTKRLKKKYNKLFIKNQNKLFAKYFGFNII